jgi:hypothetical protein
MDDRLVVREDVLEYSFFKNLNLETLTALLQQF